MVGLPEMLRLVAFVVVLQLLVVLEPVVEAVSSRVVVVGTVASGTKLDLVEPRFGRMLGDTPLVAL